MCIRDRYRRSYHVRENIRTPIGNNEIVTSETDLWKEKLQEILSFQVKGSREAVSVEQRQDLVNIYNKYIRVFSNLPGKARNFVCELRFHNSVNLNRKSYPIAQSLKEDVRQKIQRMIEEDIIERSSSPYTSPIVAIPKKDGQVRLCLDTREINKMIVNDRTSPGEINEVMKKFHGCKSS